MFRDNQKNSVEKNVYREDQYNQKRLSECKSGERIKIIKIDAGKGAKLNLMNLGLSIGNIVRIERPSRLKGPVVVNFNDTEIAVGYGLAEKIIVRDSK